MTNESAEQETFGRPTTVIEMVFDVSDSPTEQPEVVVTEQETTSPSVKVEAEKVGLLIQTGEPFKYH